jgi:hypothetical protein
MAFKRMRLFRDSVSISVNRVLVGPGSFLLFYSGGTLVGSVILFSNYSEPQRHAGTKDHKEMNGLK